jgi:divalent metal cation (Fe/Co/Zn/Cd) transporter
MAISIIMGILGIGIIGAAIDDFLMGEDEPKHRQLILGLSFVSVLMSGTMALYKFNYSAHLNSPALFKDGICSTIGAVLGAALFFNTLILQVNSSLWWIDPVVSLICGIIAIALAGQAFYTASCVEGLPLCSIRWWLMSEGHGSDETSDGDAEPKPQESEIV